MLDSDIHFKKTINDNLWVFACEVYSRPTVDDACLTLQDHYGVDIPLLLCCCWAGYHYGELSPELLQQASSFSKGWSANTTKPLRTIRRDMKTSYSQQWPVPDTDWASLRAQVKNLELASEKLMLEGLSRLISEHAKKHDEPSRQSAILTAIANIKNTFSLDKDERAVDCVLGILKQVFNESKQDLKILTSANR